MDLMWRLGILLLFLVLGYGARQEGLLSKRRTEWLTVTAFYIALPALVFYSTYDQQLRELISRSLVVGIFLVFVTIAIIAWIVHRGQSISTRRSVAVVQSYHSNLGFLGLPLVVLTLGSEATAVASFILGISGFIQIPMTIITLATLNNVDASIRSELGKLVKNPILWALMLGIVVQAVGLSIPTALDTGLGLLGEAALPLALLGAGASLKVNLSDFDLLATGSVVVLKVGVMPVITWTVFSLLTVSQATFSAVVLMFGMPSAVSTYVYASELGGDAQFASVNVFITTVASFATVAVILQFI